MKMKQHKSKLLDRAKAVLAGKFAVENTYNKEKEKFQINNLNFYLKKLQTFLWQKTI